MSETLNVLAHPSGLPVRAQRIPVRHGKTIEQMAMECYGSLDGIAAFVPGTRSQWEEVPRHMWGRVRPLKSDVLRFEFRPNGGGGGRNVFAIVAAIALTVIAPHIGSFIAGTLLGLTGTALSIGTAIAAAAVAVGGSLILQRLFPPDLASGGARIGEPESGRYQEIHTDGNVLAKGAYLPYAIERRISPPDVIQPRAYLEDGIQTFDRMLALWGKHSLSDVRIDGVPADTISQITVETLDGDEATTTYPTFIDEISVPVVLSEQLSTFQADDVTLEDQADPENSEPRWHYFSTPYHEDLEEISIRLRVDNFVTSNSATQKIRLPFRISFREKGTSTWNNLPEMHVIGRDATPFVRDIRIRWDNAFGAQDIDGELDWEFWREVPESDNELSDGTGGGQSPTEPQWQAHSLFDAGTGLQDTQRIFAKRFGVQVELDSDEIAKAEYEWRIQRGICVNNTALNSSYQISSTIHSLFLSYLNGANKEIPVGQGAFLANLSALQATAIADQNPVQWPETAIVAVKSKGQNLKNITVVASRYVNDWNGSSWSNETTSDNPATHYRHLLFEYCEHFGIDTELIDSDTFVNWRQECIDRGYKIGGVIGGESILEALQAIATAGFARPVFSDVFTVDYFRDRSSETPVQTFSPRNTEAVSFSIIFSERPAGYRVKFNNRDDDWRESEVDVAIDNAADIPSPEAISYKAIDDISLVRKRAYFDLLQLSERRRVWTVETAIEGVVCEIGDLVSVITDLFDDEAHGTRIRSVSADGHTVTIDQSITPEEAPDALNEGTGPDFADLLDGGKQSVMFVLTQDGPVMRTIIGYSADNEYIIDSPISSDSPFEDLTGAHVNITTLEDATHRCFVTGIQRKGEERATLTLVEEAPQIYTKLQERYP